MHSNNTNTRRRALRRAALLTTAAVAALTVGLSTGNASAMTNAQWRARCLSSGGDWDAYFMNGAMQYDCIWVTDSGYSIDTYRGGRFVQTCGATRGAREICDTI